MLLVFSINGILSKLAAKQPFLSFGFCVYYFSILILLAFYAIVWQQIIKGIPLTTAYANRAITVVWGIIWGWLFFRESVTIGKIIGAILVIVGVVFYSKADKEKETFLKDR